LIGFDWLDSALANPAKIAAPLFLAEGGCCIFYGTICLDLVRLGFGFIPHAKGKIAILGRHGTPEKTDRGSEQ